jgi:peptidoglycan/LPS O-acetylase OafA/YrhL
MTSKKSSLQYMTGLDGIRAIAALVVVFSHAEKHEFLPPLIRAAGGQSGVMLFFSLSGFLITVLYINREFSKSTAIKYAAARFARIYPIYFLVILCSFIIYTFIDPSFVYDMSFWEFVRHSVATGTINVFWSIPPEVQFYVVFLAIWCLIGTVRHGLMIFGMIAVPILVFLSLQEKETATALLTGNIQFFLAGLAAGLLFLRFGDQIGRRASGFEIPLLLAIFVVSWPNNFEAIFGWRHGFWDEDLIAVLTGLIVLFAAVGKDVLHGFLSSRIMRWFGAVSFFMYLVHVPLLVYAWELHKALQINPYVAFGGFWIALIVLSHLSLTYYEKPCRRIINGFVRPKIDRLSAGRNRPSSETSAL